MKIIATVNGRKALTLSYDEWETVGLKAGWAVSEGDKLTVEAKRDGWPKKLREGRFTSYCKSQGFEGPCKACADKAFKSDDASVRGMASFYMNTVKP